MWQIENSNVGCDPLQMSLSKPRPEKTKTENVGKVPAYQQVATLLPVFLSVYTQWQLCLF